MNTPRHQTFFNCVLAAGLLAWLVPGFVFYLASSFWRAVAGNIDMFEASAVLTWFILILVTALVSIIRSAYLFKRQTRLTRADLAFILLTCILAIFTAYASWRPFKAIQIFPWFPW